MLSVAVSGQEKTVNVNGSNYHVFVKGLENRKENDPVIIFESGMGVKLEECGCLSFFPILPFLFTMIRSENGIFTL